MLVSFALEFENRDSLEEVADKLWKKHGISGEMEIFPLATGRWRLNVHSEKQLRPSTIEALAGERVEAKAVATKAKPS